MKKTAALIFIALCLASFTREISADSKTVNNPYQEKAAYKSWKKSDPIPAELLHYRSTPSEDFPEPSDTFPTFNAITNYPLLFEVILYPETDEKVVLIAENRALYLVGPNRLFRDLKEAYASQPELTKQQKRYLDLSARMKERHVVVEGLYFSSEVMKNSEIRRALSEVENELEQGKSWDEASEKLFKRYNDYYYPVERRRSKRNRRLLQTITGNVGRIILSPIQLYVFSLSEFTKAHIVPLLSADQGDILVLYDQDKEEWFLYRVVEVYL